MIQINNKYHQLVTHFWTTDIYRRACSEYWMSRVDGEGGYLEPAFFKYLLEGMLIRRLDEKT